jgi:hypothetical protein
MFRYFRLKKDVQPAVTLPGTLSGELLARDAISPIAVRQLNTLPENTKRRIYRGLLPPTVLTRFEIDPLTWESKNGSGEIELQVEPESGVAKVTIHAPQKWEDELLALEIQDNAFDGIDLNLIVLGDPQASRFDIDRDENGKPTMFGTLGRNLKEEQRAMEAGLAPGQVRKGLGGSQVVLDQLESFLAALGQRAYFLEPLTYVSAWVFEKRGFAYVRGHKLMENIQREFQPGGALFRALDGDTPFRSPAHWSTVRGRAWAIQDGILEAIDTRWDKLRMVKQIGRHAGVETFPDAIY